MVHINYKDSKNIIEAFSEDWAEIRSAVEVCHRVVFEGRHEERRKELDKILSMGC